MDNVNSVGSAGPIVNSMGNVDNSAVIRRRGGAAGRKSALLSTLSMLLTIGPTLRTQLTLSMLSILDIAIA